MTEDIRRLLEAVTYALERAGSDPPEEQLRHLSAAYVYCVGLGRQIDRELFNVPDFPPAAMEAE